MFQYQLINLPDDVLLEIISRLDVDDILRLRKVRFLYFNETVLILFCIDMP